MENIIIIAVLILLVGLAIFYMWKEKKAGKKCIGCPCSGGCDNCKTCNPKR